MPKTRPNVEILMPIEEPFHFTAEEASDIVRKVKEHRERVEAAIAAGEPVPVMRRYDPAVDEIPAGPPDRPIHRPKLKSSAFTRAQAKAAVAAADEERRRRRTAACPNCGFGADDG